MVASAAILAHPSALTDLGDGRSSPVRWSRTRIPRGSASSGVRIARSHCGQTRLATWLLPG